LCRSFGGQTVLDHASWFVAEDDRVALVGANGSGKSTLLKMIAGLEVADEGAISITKGGTVGYLPQDGISAAGHTVFETALEAFDGLRELEKECQRLEQELGTADPSGDGYGQILEDYSTARERWDHEGCYDYESRAEAVLEGLGFSGEDFHRDGGEFSGGWQMRIALAVLLLEQPDILLLDEPTNHLDLEARNWLEEFLRDYPHAVILVAHDRYFLDVVAKRITEISGGKLNDYPAPYSKFEKVRAETLQQERAAYESQQEEITRIEAFVSRFRYQASKAALVQSRIKYLDKLVRLPAPAGGSRRVRFRFPPCPRSGRQVLRLEGARKAYGDLVVYQGLDLTIERGEKVALVGPNGAGKSTLIRMLAGVEAPTSGQRILGHNVDLGYFAQDQSAALDSTKTILEETTNAAPFEVAPQVRQLLGAFLFSGEAVDKPIRVLSGGERHRLALALLLLRKTNCLLLDEPTNHLDMTAKAVLLSALRDYDGTVIIVAHDRYILDELPQQIIEVGAGNATRYIGNYEEYLRQKAAQDSENSGHSAQAYHVHDAATPDDADSPIDERETKSKPQLRDGAGRQKQARKRAKRKRDLESAEAAICRKENDLTALETQINQPDFHDQHENPQALYSEYAKLKKEVDSLYGKLERLEASLAKDASPTSEPG